MTTETQPKKKRNRQPKKATADQVLDMIVTLELPALLNIHKATTALLEKHKETRQEELKTLEGVV